MEKNGKLLSVVPDMVASETSYHQLLYVFNFEGLSAMIILNPASGTDN